MVITNNVIQKCINANDNLAYNNIDNIEWNNLNKGDNFFHNFLDFLVDIFWTGEVIFVFSVHSPRDQVSYTMTSVIIIIH